MEGKGDDEVMEIESVCSRSFSDDSDDDSQELIEEPLTEKDIQEIVSEFLQVESKAAEAQEAREEEFLAKVESEVRQELKRTLVHDELETAVSNEMVAFKEDCEAALDELETESANLLEQLDGAGIDLPKLYKLIEREAPDVCFTQAWKTRNHWVGSETTAEISKSIADAEKFLNTNRPVRSRHGKFLEEGASGFLQKKLLCEGEGDWDLFNKIVSDHGDAASFGTRQWASVYLASTPQEAALMGLEFPGVNEVEEIDDVDDGKSTNDPFFAAAIANERELDHLSDEQRRQFKKVKEEDDAILDKKLQIRLRHQKKSKQRKRNTHAVSLESQIQKPFTVDHFSPVIEQRGTKRLNDGELDEADTTEEKLDCGTLEDQSKIKSLSDAVVCSSSSDSDGKMNVNISSNGRPQKIRRILDDARRILDDAELGDETKEKIAIEKERLKSIEMSSGDCNGNLTEDDAQAAGCIVNVVREIGEEVVRIPSSISAKLKEHQVAGIRFMWENIIQSIRKVKSGDKGLGCILAHTMGLGKTFQVIAFLYTAMRSVDLGLRTALIVTPVSVLHNWRREFIKWAPSELTPLRVFMLEDVSSDRRAHLLAEWRAQEGVLLIGYSAFRNLSLGKNAKDPNMAREISHALLEGPDILVCDEAHMIKNNEAEITQALKQVKCQRRIALTGSPLQNNLMEYYCMVDFVRQGFLGSSCEFKNRFQNPIENGQHTNSTRSDVKIMNQMSHILYQELRGFVQRMDMNVVKKDLPPKTVFVITAKLSPLQKKLYKRFLNVHQDENSRKRCFFAGYQTLARIWNHPGILQLTKDFKESEDAAENFLVDDTSSDENNSVLTGEKGWCNDLLHGKIYEELGQSGKMILLMDILTMSSDVGDKVLVFSQSIPTLDLIELYLSRIPRRGEHAGEFWKKGIDWYRLDGKTESSERQKLVEKFNEPLNRRVKCMLISTRAGSLGINLHAANRVVIVDGSWNPTYDLQAIYRAWRYGQKKPVFAYRLLAHRTMEEKIYKRQVTKEGLSARVIDRQQVHRTMSKEEMLDLFEFGGDDDDKNPETLAEPDKENGYTCDKSNPILTEGHSLKETNESSSCSDMLMESLLSKHRPRWIANFHEHETLLQENEEEKLSKEEQDMAWEAYRNRNSMKWEEVQRVPFGEAIPDQKPEVTEANPHVSETPFMTQKCTDFAHVLTLRQNGIHMGSSTVCGKCAQEISWEALKRIIKQRAKLLDT